MKIAVVGPQEDRWTEEQKEMAKRWIRHLLKCYLNGYKPIIMKEGESLYPSPCGFGIGEKVELPVIMISGHCPKGGVDIWAEEIADRLGIQKEIYPAEANQWEDKITEVYDSLVPISRRVVEKGYRSRNIQIAEACDVLYCIVPKTANVDEERGDLKEYYSTTDKKRGCIHCKILGHPTNGGCWTLSYAKRLGKETYLVVIE